MEDGSEQRRRGSQVVIDNDDEESDQKLPDNNNQRSSEKNSVIEEDNLIKRSNKLHPYVPTPDDKYQAEQMAAVGIPMMSIARVLGIQHDTMMKHFGEELEIARTKANYGVGRTLYEKAMDGDNTCIIWWDKTRGGHSDTTRTEVTGANGQPLTLMVDAARRESREEWLARQTTDIIEDDRDELCNSHPNEDVSTQDTKDNDDNSQD